MRVKSLVAGVGLSVAAALALGPAVANASRGSDDPPVEIPAPVEEPAEPVETPDEPVEEPADPVEETPDDPVEETADDPVEETTDDPVEEEDPAVDADGELNAEEPPAAPEPLQVESVPVVDVEPQEAPEPAADQGKVKADKVDKAAKQPCHMDSYEPRDVDSLNGGEADRAAKVDRNDNGTVCRKDIPGKGRGNTGEGSNIKDDKTD